jgi:ribonuclease P protein component
MLRGSRRHRLTGTGAFEEVFRCGVRREGEYLQLVCAAAARECGRVGFVIGRSALPLAVDRNRVRRMLRAVMHRARPAVEGHDVIVRLKRRPSRAEFPKIAAEAVRLLATLAPRTGPA